jgi:hypothetical protein
VNNVIITLSNEKMTNIKFVDHEKLRNFVVEKFFYLNSFRAPKCGLKNYFAECFTLALGKEAFADFFFLHSAKKLICREPFIGRSAIFAECRGFTECFLFGSRQRPKKTLGKADSGSAWPAAAGAALSSVLACLSSP